jgi:hypothetical protein
MWKGGTGITSKLLGRVTAWYRFLREWHRYGPLVEVEIAMGRLSRLISYGLLVEVDIAMGRLWRLTSQVLWCFDENLLCRQSAMRSVQVCLLNQAF